VIVGRLIPAGTGLAYHADRRRKRNSGKNDVAEASAALSEITSSESDQETRISEE